MTPKSKEQASCDICDKTVLRRNFYRHMIDVHNYTQDEINRMKEEYRKNTQSRANKLTVYCPVCGDRFVDHESLANHCNEKHSDEGANGVEQNYTVYSLTFQTKDEFEIFLREQCEKTISSLYQRAHKGKSYSLRCNRSGLFRSASTVCARMSRKGVSHCSCFTNYTVNDDGTIQMKGCFGHIGHDIEPALLPLTEGQKQHLRHLLEGHSLEYVIRRMRSDFSPKTSRLHFVTKSDLRNIMQKYGMGPGLRNNNDLTSPQMQVDENNFDDGKQMLDKAEDPSGKRFTSGGKRRRLATASFRTQQTLTCHGSAVTHHEGKRLKIRSIARRKLEEGETSEKAHLAESNGQYGCEPGPSSNVEEAHSKTAKKEVVCKVQLAAADPMVHTQVQMELRKAWRSKIQMLCSVLSANVSALVNTDTKDAMVKLNEIHELIERASKITAGVPRRNYRSPPVHSCPGLVGGGRSLQRRSCTGERSNERNVVRIVTASVEDEKTAAINPIIHPVIRTHS